MQRRGQGTWYVQVQENLENWYYLYQVTVQGSTRTAVDPYVRGNTSSPDSPVLVHTMCPAPDVAYLAVV